MKRFVKLQTGHFIEVSKDTKHGYSFGWRVTREGERFEKETATTTTQFLIVFHASEIVNEYTMNLHYGRLEPTRAQ